MITKKVRKVQLKRNVENLHVNAQKILLSYKTSNCIFKYSIVNNFKSENQSIKNTNFNKNSSKKLPLLIYCRNNLFTTRFGSRIKSVNSLSRSFKGKLDDEKKLSTSIYNKNIKEKQNIHNLSKRLYKKMKDSTIEKTAQLDSNNTIEQVINDVLKKFSSGKNKMLLHFETASKYCAKTQMKSRPITPIRIEKKVFSPIKLRCNLFVNASGIKKSEVSKKSVKNNSIEKCFSKQLNEIYSHCSSRLNTVKSVNKFDLYSVKTMPNNTNKNKLHLLNPKINIPDLSPWEFEDSDVNII